jgi:hypothetical protein
LRLAAAISPAERNSDPTEPPPAHFMAASGCSTQLLLSERFQSVVRLNTDALHARRPGDEQQDRQRGTRENLSAVLATDGYKHLVEKCPSTLAELLKAAHGRKRSRSTNAR